VRFVSIPASEYNSFASKNQGQVWFQFRKWAYRSKSALITVAQFAGVLILLPLNLQNTTTSYAHMLIKEMWVLLKLVPTITVVIVNRGIFWIFFYVLNSTLLHLPPLRLHCVGGCWDRTQACCDFDICSQTL
jgi:hypothetical protein